MGNTAADEVELQATDKPFADKIEAMSGYGLSTTDIALVLAIDETELLSGQAVTAAIFWLKTRARWKEVHRDGDADGPVVVQIQRFAADL